MTIIERIIWLVFAFLAGFLFFLAMAAFVNADSGLIMKDPLWRYSKSPAKQNRIVWDSSRRRTAYWLNDPIFDDGRFIVWKADNSPNGLILPDPIFDDSRALTWDLDPVGE